LASNAVAHLVEELPPLPIIGRETLLHLRMDDEGIVHVHKEGDLGLARHLVQANSLKRKYRENMKA
tara:strand:- start:53 stop:250 length:198 start_codon:yes stop_codon:yes gene_type:complete